MLKGGYLTVYFHIKIIQDHIKYVHPRANRTVKTDKIKINKIKISIKMHEFES